MDIIAVALCLFVNICLTQSFFPITKNNKNYNIYYNYYHEPNNDNIKVNNNNDEYQLEKPQRPPKLLPKLQRQTKLSNDGSKEPVLVLGATGRIGRRVVKQLLSQGVSVRALVRDYDKAIELLEEDDEEYDNSNDIIYSYASIRKEEEAKLEIIEDEFISNYDDNITNSILFKSIKGCSTIISCIGTYRKSNIMRDFFPPWRMLNYNVSKWCKSNRGDDQHPYYVHYLFTKRLLSCIEQHKLLEQEDNKKNTLLSNYDNYDFEDNDKGPNKKYKIIRISDLNVAYKPYSIVSVITNTLQSMIFRYQYLSENLLRRSNLVHYVILRPGDLVEDDRVSIIKHSFIL